MSFALATINTSSSTGSVNSNDPFILDDDFEKAKAFNKRKGFNLPIYALASPLPAMYESSAIPTTYVIDAAGNLALTHKGMADYDNKKFKAFLKSLQ